MELIIDRYFSSTVTETEDFWLLLDIGIVCIIFL